MHVCDYAAILEAYGRAVAERALKVAADTLAGALRQGDTLARWGGEDFVVITPGIATHNLERIAGRLSRLLSQSCIVVGAGLVIDLPAAISGALARSGDDPAALVHRCTVLLDRRPGSVSLEGAPPPTH